MDHKEILKNVEKNMIQGNNKAQVYNEVTQLAGKYEQIYNEYESDKKKLDNLTIHNKDLKQANQNLMVKVLSNKSFQSSTPEHHNGIDSLLNNLM